MHIPFQINLIQQRSYWWQFFWCLAHGLKVKGVWLRTTICDSSQSRSRAIFSFDHWLSPKYYLDLWPNFVDFRNIFVHYLIRIALTVYQKHLTIVLPFELPCLLTCHLNVVADRSTESIAVTPPWKVIRQFYNNHNYYLQLGLFSAFVQIINRFALIRKMTCTIYFTCAWWKLLHIHAYILLLCLQGPFAIY